MNNAKTLDERLRTSNTMFGACFTVLLACALFVMVMTAMTSMSALLSAGIDATFEANAYACIVTIVFVAECVVAYVVGRPPKNE